MGTTTTPIDLGPAAERVGALVRAVPDGDLDRPTPCAEYSLGDLLDYIGALGPGFRSAADKSVLLADPTPPPPGDGARLESGWRERIPLALVAMADAWRVPDAWTGLTRAGGLDLPAEIVGLVALEELVVHGWDLAAAIGRPYAVEPAEIEACRGILEQFAGVDGPGTQAGIYGPPVDVAPDASPLDRLVALAGRDPAWVTRSGR